MSTAALGAATAANLSDWWYALVTYRGQADSIVTGSLTGRLHLAGLCHEEQNREGIIRPIAAFTGKTVQGICDQT